jgi:polysaccharide biosynthesis transport protein
MGNLMIRTKNDAIGPATDSPGYPPGSFTPPPQVDVRRVWRAFLNRRWLILVITAAVLIPVTVYSFLIAPTYLSTVVVQVDPEAVKVLPYNSVSDSLVSAPADFELYMRTQDEVLRSPALIDRVVQNVRRNYPQPTMPILRPGFAAGIDIVRVQGSQMMKISYESYDPDYSALVANTMAEEFVKLHFERKVETTRKATEFLQKQLTALKQKVEDAEAGMIRYAAQHDILATGGNQENVVRQRLGLLNTQVADSERQFVNAQAAYDEIKSATVDAMPGSLRTPEMTNLEAKVLGAEQELSTLLTQFGENWPPVVRKRDELTVVRKQLADLKRESLVRAKRDAERNFLTARAQNEKLTQALKEQQAAVNRLNEASIQYNTLKREVDAGDQLYQGLLQRLKETGVSAALEFGNLHVTDPAIPLRYPYRPKRLWNVSLALLLGLSAGMALAFFLEYLDTSLKNPADLEPMGIPLLGWVPSFASTKSMPKKQDRQSLLTSAAGSSSETALQVRSVTTWDLQAREAYRLIFASLLLSRPGNPARTILITSSVPKEGKTTTVANLGATLAESGLRTLLIDSDFRNPALSRRFGAGSGNGLSIYLAGGAKDIRATDSPNLFLLPAGPFPPNPVALFASARFSEFLAALKQEFQFILIDSPPLLSLADSSIISSKVDGVILIIKTEETPKEIFSQAHMQLARSGACLLGAAATHVNLKNAQYHYYRKYYSAEERYTAVGGTSGRAS